LAEAEYLASDGSGRIGVARAIIGLVQGVALYGLFDAFQFKTWPATDGPLFAALCTTAIFVPLLVVSALTHLRSPLLFGWTLIVTLICVGLAWYDIYRDPIALPWRPPNLPSPQLWFALALGLFIGHSLLTSGVSDGRLIARYPTYFGVSWKYGLQAAMAVLFAGVFWLVLWLGAELFRLIKIDWLWQLIQKNWFWIPATTIALTYALHVTDVRVGIIRGIRTLACNLLSWLLPLMTLIAVSFVAALPFTGLEPLWSTRHASSILLVAAASLIFLINAAYQDGVRVDEGPPSEARPLPRLLRLTMTAAAAVLIPLVLLAAYGISLRIGQYGWTPERVVATACTIIAACHAAGYAFAAIHWDQSLPRLEITNVASAFIVLAILLALFTPLADPARISVADQVRRLNAGLIAPEKFDYSLLRFGTGRFGVDALRKLAEQKDLPVASEKSAEILQRNNRHEAQREAERTPPRLTAAERAGNITVAWPKGQSLPSAFLEADRSNNSQRPSPLPSCLTGHTKCDAVLTNLSGDGDAEIILLPVPFGQAVVFRLGDNHSWSFLGSLAGSNCPGVRDALLAGTFEVVQPAFKELETSGRRLRLVAPSDCSADTIFAVTKH
jgi:Domain of unknown function (DUF4153)